ncbi:MAG TPA: YcxB family protein [Luteolibacter sp.]|nr:YcxB family protein [Luteolibacter sp.]
MFLLWLLLLQPWLARRRIAAASDLELSRATEHEVVLTAQDIRVRMHGEESITPWSDVDRVVVTPDELRILFANQDFLWIARDSRFRTGDWEGLLAFLKPWIAGD